MGVTANSDEIIAYFSVASTVPNNVPIQYSVTNDNDLGDCTLSYIDSAGGKQDVAAAVSFTGTTYAYPGVLNVNNPNAVILVDCGASFGDAEFTAELSAAGYKSGSASADAGGA